MTSGRIGVVRPGHQHHTAPASIMQGAIILAALLVDSLSRRQA
jgi:hypothetical protein